MLVGIASIDHSSLHCFTRYEMIIIAVSFQSNPIQGIKSLIYPSCVTASVEEFTLLI